MADQAVIGEFAFGEAPFAADNAGIARAVIGTGDTALTSTSAVIRLRLVNASVSGAASVSAVAAFIARMSGAASIAVTVTSGADRIRLLDGAAAASVSAVNAFSRIRGMNAAVEVVTTASGQIIGVFVMSGNLVFRINQETLANVLGDAWTVVPEGSETWAIQPSSGSWSVQAEGSETWSIVPEGSETWTPVSAGSETWSNQ